MSDVIHAGLASQQSLLTASPVALVIFLFTIFTSLFTLFLRRDLYRMFLLHPWSFVREKRYYTLITSGLIHADMGHLFFNMFTFYFFAFPLELFLGHWQFAVLYGTGLALSDITTIARHRNNRDYYCLGASGAVTAVLFSYIVHNPTAGIMIMLIPIAIPAWLFAVLYLAFSYHAARRQRSHINHAAHLWGAITGLLMTAILHPSAYRMLFEMLR